jgi:hypothetical protein
LHGGFFQSFQDIRGKPQICECGHDSLSDGPTGRLRPQKADSGKRHALASSPCQIPCVSRNPCVRWEPVSGPYTCSRGTGTRITGRWALLRHMSSICFVSPAAAPISVGKASAINALRRANLRALGSSLPHWPQKQGRGLSLAAYARHSLRRGPSSRRQLRCWRRRW